MTAKSDYEQLRALEDAVLIQVREYVAMKDPKMAAVLQFPLIKRLFKEYRDAASPRAQPEPANVRELAEICARYAVEFFDHASQIEGHWDGLVDGFMQLLEKEKS
jgi:hypothetical protein